jgi:hypothetical protein
MWAASRCRWKAVVAKTAKTAINTTTRKPVVMERSFAKDSRTGSPDNLKGHPIGQWYGEP